MTKLYIRGNDGVLRFWAVEPSSDGLEMTHGAVGGAVQSSWEMVDAAKQGRNWDEQVESRMESRINKKLDAGYVHDIDLARNTKATNALGLAKPMLATPSAKIADLYEGEAYVQHKYDGNRCLIHNSGNGAFAYTRNGKLFNTLGHILDDLELPVGATIDGELYHHGTPLQTIVSWAKRKQPNTKKLVLMAYDIISPEPFSKRLEALRNLDLTDSIKIAETNRYGGSNPIGFNPSVLNSLLTRAIAMGYEGKIVRKGNLGYQDGKRSKSLIKVKRWTNAEVSVINIIPSEDGWGRCVCLFHGKLFHVSAPGDMRQKTMALRQKEDYIGKVRLTIQYANLTVNGVPFHPVAIAWRDYE